MAKIIIVGDLFPIKANIDLFSKGDVQTLFGDRICKLFSESDLRICNLEGALTDGNEKCDKTGPVICAPTSALNAYKKLGIDYCMLANNHITDAGQQGVVETMQTLENAGIRHLGVGLNETSIRHHDVQTLAGKTICFYNVCERMYNKPGSKKAGTWLYDEYIVCREMEQLKNDCDYLIVIYHGGIEKFRYPSPEIKKRFHRMADSGADIVISQHTHCIGCEEYYNDSYLLYGQGDFLLNNFKPEITNLGLIVELSIDEGELHIRKHMVKSSNNLRLEYVDNPDFTAFNERSVKMKDGAFLEEQFRQFSMRELPLYLTAFKSPGGFFRKLKKYRPGLYRDWLCKKAYSRKNLMFTLHTLRSEQNREIAIAGIESLLNLK